MDMEALMAQAAELQTKVAAAQEKLSQTTVKGVSSNGACVIDMTGKYDVLKVAIHPSLLPHGVDVVSETILSAIQDAKQKADNIIDKIMGEATAGMPIPQQ